MVAKIAPEIYQNCITIETKANEVLYIWMIKGVFGIMMTTLIFYLNLLKDIKYRTLQINYYKPFFKTRSLKDTKFIYPIM